MKVLVIGNACREHAIVHALLQDKQAPTVYTLPKRTNLKHCIGLPDYLLQNTQDLITYLKKESIQLIVIGPEQALNNFLPDKLREQGFKVFAPSTQAAQLETSKIFAKTFMKKQAIPTGSYRVVSSVSQALDASSNFSPPFVLKADGLASGKGVFLCKDLKELKQKSQFLFEQKGLGDAGERALLEDFQQGQEISVFAITNGDSYSLLPVAQDYKRLHNGQAGPNTGGMGAIAPIDMSSTLINSIKNLIIEPTLKGLNEQQSMYRGVLYFGLMIHKNFPKILEYNVRFGDPEAQVLLPLLDGSWLDVFYKTACGQSLNLKWKNIHAACVVLCDKNYPEGPLKDTLIQGSLDCKTDFSWFLQGAVKEQDKQYFTSGGRVLNSISIGQDQQQAVTRAYKHIKNISWSGMHYRTDIGS